MTFWKNPRALPTLESHPLAIVYTPSLAETGFPRFSSKWQPDQQQPASISWLGRVFERPHGAL